VREGDLAGFFKNKWTRRLALWVLASVALIYGWYQINYPTCTFRYKLTAEVMTPEGLKTGSSVIEVNYSHNADYGGGNAPDLNAVGEAVFIPIDQKRLFVVTLTNDAADRTGKQFRGYYYEPKYLWGALDLYALPLKTFNLDWKLDERGLCRQVEEVAKTNRRFPAPLPSLPTLVVFEDVNDPYSVKVVQPDKLFDVLGEGYALQNVWLQITTEIPTNTEMRMFPWWQAKSEEWKSKWIFSIDDRLIDQLYYRAFKQPTIVGKPK
jgi:hypothetical protein